MFRDSVKPMVKRVVICWGRVADLWDRRIFYEFIYFFSISGL